MPGSSPKRSAFRRSYSIDERTVQRMIVMAWLGQRTLKTQEWLMEGSKDPSMTLSIVLNAIDHLPIRSSARVITNSSSGQWPCFHLHPHTITKTYSWRMKFWRSDRRLWALRAVNTTDCRSLPTPAATTSRFSRKQPGKACVPSRLSTQPSLTQLCRVVWTN